MKPFRILLAAQLLWLVASSVPAAAAEHYALQWATWLGGSGNDSQEASLRLDQNHHVFVLPYTFSTDAPITAGARLYIRLIHEQSAPDPHRPLLVNIGGHFALPNKSR